MDRDAIIYFRDNIPLNTAHEATYLGNNLNLIVNLKREIYQKIQDIKWMQYNALLILGKKNPIPIRNNN